MEPLIHKQIFDELSQAKQIVFISDERVDGDSLGASLAMVDFMKSQGKDVPVLLTRTISPQYLNLPHIDHCTQDLNILKNPDVDLVVTFDCSDKNYIEGLISLIPERPKIINIDHHSTNPLYGDINQVVVDASATADVVHHFYKVNNIPLTKEASSCLLAGIFFDTTVFRNSATNDRVLVSASELIRGGAKVSRMFKTVHQERSVQALKVWGLMMERLCEVKGEDGVCTYLLAKDLEDHNVKKEELDGITNYLHSVTTADVLYVYLERPEGVKVSMRSIKTNVGQVAKDNGGGGHVRSAGYTVPESILNITAEGYPEIKSIVK